MGKIDNIIKKLTEAPEDNLPKVNKNNKFKVGDTAINNDTKSTVTAIDKETGRISWGIQKLPNLEELFDTSTELTQVAKDVYIKTKSDKKLRLIYDDARLLRNQIRTHIRNEYPEEYRRITMKMSEGLDENQLSVSDMVNLNDKRVEAVAKAIVDKYNIPDDGRLKGVIRVALSDYLEEMFSKNILDANEKEVEEISTSGAAGAYLTPYAFRLNKKALGTDDDTYVKQLGYKLAPNQVKQ